MTSEKPNVSIDQNEFSGKRVFVTGGTKGAGEAIVRRFAAGGARIATTARSAPTDSSDLPGFFVAGDLRTSAGAAHAADAVVGSLGAPDIVVHNLGTSKSPGGGFAALTDELWLDELNLNLLAAVRLDRAFVPAMVERGTGVVIHIASIQRRLPLPDSTTAYAAAKAALWRFLPDPCRFMSATCCGATSRAALRIVAVPSPWKLSGSRLAATTFGCCAQRKSRRRKRVSSRNRGSVDTASTP